MVQRSSPREALVADATDYLLAHGLADLSLRPLAAAMGTSARMLVYHFGSKERLIAEAMNEVRLRQRKLAEKWMRRRKAASLEKMLQLVWWWVAAPRHEPYVRLWLEVLARGTRQASPFADFARGTFEDWVTWAELRFAAGGRPPETAKSLAILTVSTVRGLALYSMATGDKRGATRALRRFARMAPARQAPL